MSLLLDRLHRAARRARVPRHRCALAGLLLLLATTFWPALASAQSADLQVSQHDVSPDPVGRGASSDFTIRITNNGPAAANGAVVTITVAPRYEVLNQPGTSFPATCTLSGVVGAQQLRADFRTQFTGVEPGSSSHPRSATPDEVHRCARSAQAAA